MNTLTVLPLDLAAMSADQLSNLPVEKLQEVDRNIDEALTWLKDARGKLDAALDRRFGAAARTALRDSGRDFGTAHVDAEGLHVKFELPKKVSWDQAKLNAIAKRISASGEPIENYIDVKLSITESRYTNWPPALQKQFADARTVAAGKPKFEITMTGAVVQS